LTEDDASVAELSKLISEIKNAMVQCDSCFRYFAKNGGGGTCLLCNDGTRDRSKLMVVERDADIQAIERSNMYDGLYFVLGGSVPLLESDDIKQLNGGALKATVEERAKNDGLLEIILAFAVNPDGENTTRYARKLISEVLGDDSKVGLSLLGRGLSTGSELEYADPETIKNALQNRG
jgi:recombination protein RecR